jgi:hypothetical protein
LENAVGPSATAVAVLSSSVSRLALGAGVLRGVGFPCPLDERPALPFPPVASEIVWAVAADP